MIKDTNYFAVCGWMRNRLHLKGNDLIVYAVINSFSQDGKSEYKGSNSYLADFTGAGERTISRILADLEKRKLIEKTNDNASTGQFNGWTVVPLEKLETLGIIPKEGDSQNGDPPSPEWQPPDSQNGNPPVAKMATPNKVDNNISHSNLSDINLDNKESKKVSREEVSYKPSAGAREHPRESYDEIIAKYELSDEVREAVGEFLQHCAANNKTPTNKALYRVMDALMTYPEERRCKALQGVIDGNLYTLKPLTEKHYDMFGVGNNERRDYQTVMEDCLKEYLGENADFVISKLWEFIQHCAANGQKITNDRLMSLCFKLKKLYRPAEFVEMRKALDKAISGGYYDIKDGEGWIAQSVAYGKAMGLPLIGDDIDESEDKVG